MKIRTNYVLDKTLVLFRQEIWSLHSKKSRVTPGSKTWSDISPFVAYLSTNRAIVFRATLLSALINIATNFWINGFWNGCLRYNRHHNIKVVWIFSACLVSPKNKNILSACRSDLWSTDTTRMATLTYEHFKNSVVAGLPGVFLVHWLFLRHI